MVDQPGQIDEHHDQEKIKEHGNPERADPDQNVAEKRQIDLFQESAENVRQRQKKKNDEVGNAESRTRWNRLPAANENIIIRRTINGQHDAEKDDEVDGFHNIAL